MFKILCLTIFVVGAFASVDEEFENFKQQFNKEYENEAEEMRRKSIFSDNLDFIAKHNNEYDQGIHSFDVGVNKYADMTNEEFVGFMNGFQGDHNSPNSEIHEPTLEEVPHSVDWRKKGYVTPIKNQGQCGSCWAFSTIASLEGQHFKKTGKLVSLSEQNLVDCDKNVDECCSGCGGGLMTAAFDFIKKENGVDTEKSYPYKAVDEKCAFKKNNVGATVTGYKAIKKGSEKDLTEAAATVGPISVAIDASHQSFQLYKSGVYYEPACSSTALDHGVTVVGYGTHFHGKHFYIVKNSWGESWGMKGYIYMSRNKKNNCGIATSACYPTV